MALIQGLNEIAAKLHWNQFKFGVLFLGKDQTTESEMYENGMWEGGEGEREKKGRGERRREDEKRKDGRREKRKEMKTWIS
jgi:hypothetical protein